MCEFTLLQADTYRRMRKATKGRWEGFHPATNALWMHYLADTLLNLKAFPLDAGQKRQLRDFRYMLCHLTASQLPHIAARHYAVLSHDVHVANPLQLKGPRASN